MWNYKEFFILFTAHLNKLNLSFISEGGFMLKSLVTLLLLTALGFSNADAQYIFVSSDFETEGTKTSTYTVSSPEDIFISFVHTPGIAIPPLSYPLIFASRIRVYINDVLQFSSGGNLSIINYWSN